MTKEKKLLKIINTVLVNADLPEIIKISPEISLRDELEFDSLNLAELTVRVEEEFGVDIFEDDMVNTIKEILDKI